MKELLRLCIGLSVTLFWTDSSCQINASGSMISLFQAFFKASKSLSPLSHKINEPLYLLHSTRDNKEIKSKADLVSFGQLLLSLPLFKVTHDCTCESLRYCGSRLTFSWSKPAFAMGKTSAFLSLIPPRLSLDSKWNHSPMGPAKFWKLFWELRMFICVTSLWAFEGMCVRKTSIRAKWKGSF